MYAPITIVMPDPQSFVAPTYCYRIRGERQLSDETDPPLEIIEATSELRAAAIYWHRHGRRRFTLFKRVA